MFTRNFTIFINVLPLFVIIWDLKCALSMPKRYRIYRTKGPPSMPPILQFSGPIRSAQNFHSDYAPPPSMIMSGMSSYSPPGPSFDSPNNFLTDYQPPAMEYGPPKINNEYGPPTTLKPVVHKHVTKNVFSIMNFFVKSVFAFFLKIYVHIPPPEPEEPIIR